MYGADSVVQMLPVTYPAKNILIGRGRIWQLISQISL